MNTMPFPDGWQAEQLAADSGEGAKLTQQLGLSRLCKFTLDLSVGRPLGGNASVAAGQPSGASGRGAGKQEAKDGDRQQQHKPLLPAVVVGDTDVLAAPGDGVSCSSKAGCPAACITTGKACKPARLKSACLRLALMATCLGPCRRGTRRMQRTSPSTAR
jgi:hypothetical protein